MWFLIWKKCGAHLLLSVLKIGKPVLIYALCNFGVGGFHVKFCVFRNFQVTQRFCQNKLLFNCLRCQCVLKCKVAIDFLCSGSVLVSQHDWYTFLTQMRLIWTGCSNCHLQHLLVEKKKLCPYVRSYDDLRLPIVATLDVSSCSSTHLNSATGLDRSLKALASWRWRMKKSGWFSHDLQEPQGEQATETYIFYSIFTVVSTHNGFMMYMCHFAWVCYPVITNIRDVWTERGAMLCLRSLNFVHYYNFKIHLLRLFSNPPTFM